MRIKRRTHIFLLAALVLPVQVLPSRPPGQDKPPNIIFFLSDDQRHDQMGSAGHTIIKTPTMDRLAREGTRFSRAFVTTSICAASRATIFTGLYERSHKFTFLTPPIAKKRTDLSYPALLRQAGYRTGFVGKFGVGVEPNVVEQMFDVFEPLDRAPYFKSLPDGTTRHISQIAGDKAIEFMRTQPKDQPFCLSISFNAPHAEDGDKENHYPWPRAVDGMYEDVTVPPPPLSDPKIFDGQPEFLRKSMNRQRWFWRWDTPEKYQKNIKGYYRMISGVDHVMERVLEEVGQRGLAENTVVIFSGDNGYYLGSRGFAGKWSHYEESLRVPLIIYDPRVEPKNRGQVVDAMALNLDIPATILDLAKVKVPDTYQGQSVVGFVSGKRPARWRRDFFCEHLMHYPDALPKYEGVRGQRWVYARYFEQTPVYEFLHDLETDPRQLQNLALESDYAETLAEMRRRTDELMKRHGGPYSREKFPSSEPPDRR